MVTFLGWLMIVVPAFFHLQPTKRTKRNRAHRYAPRISTDLSPTTQLDNPIAPSVFLSKRCFSATFSQVDHEFLSTIISESRNIIGLCLFFLLWISILPVDSDERIQVAGGQPCNKLVT